MCNRNSQERDNTRFPGYGDRVGSAIELAPTKWQGGEVISQFLFKLYLDCHRPNANHKIN